MLLAPCQKTILAANVGGSWLARSVSKSARLKLMRRSQPSVAGSSKRGKLTEMRTLPEAIAFALWFKLTLPKSVFCDVAIEDPLGV